MQMLRVSLRSWHMYRRFMLLIIFPLWLAAFLPASVTVNAQDAVTASAAVAVDSTFTYKGYLLRSGTPVNGTCDLRFRLYDAASGGVAIGSALTRTGVVITNGSFATSLNFGNVFTGDKRWLLISIKCASDPSFVNLSPRDAINAVPYAMSLMPGAVISGTVASPQGVITVQTLGVGGIAVRGTGDNGIGVYGASNYGTGVYGISSNGYGVFGASSNGYGVSGISTQVNGIYGVTSRASTTEYAGVSGFANGTNGIGVIGQATIGTNAWGVYARGSGVGVYGVATTAAGVGVEGGALNNSTTSGYAGLFSGRVWVTGNLSKGGGSFKIDHPLDPANKYLSHSFVESPDMKNIYDGVVTTDGNGDAVVQLPAYFQALNRDFRYQLTVIGAFAQAIIAKEIENNQFAIKTDQPNIKVSWQVTGIRQDAYANANRIVVEEEKVGKEKGRYLHPEAYGQVAAAGIAPLQNEGKEETPVQPASGVQP